MTKRLFLSFLAATVVLSSGCHFFRKSKKPKESSAIAADTEAEFRQRWIAKRVAELNAQGVAAPAAQEQANKEYRDKYVFAQPLK
jgi:1,2-phenylacetyl-CoA epoxidase catalytic subunit